MWEPRLWLLTERDVPACGPLTLGLPRSTLRAAWTLEFSSPEAGAKPMCTNRGLSI